MGNFLSVPRLRRSGTLNTQFSPPLNSDTLQKTHYSREVTTKLHCISAMDQYKNKSLEELRFEDYGIDGKKDDTDHFIEIIEESQVSMQLK